jgi:HAD superfamily hydrolase (TIGR01509 family)
VKAVLFDLDDTLVPDFAAFEAAVDDVTAAAGAPAGIATTLRDHARPVWYSADVARWPRAMGLSSWGALWAAFAGAGPRLEALRAWAPGYRRAAWAAALAEHGADPAAASGLAASLPAARRARCAAYRDVAGALDALSAVRIAVVTNGLPDHQWLKLETAGLTRHVDLFVASGAIGIAKPDARVFEVTLERLGLDPGEAVMVGDNPENDVDAARRAGVRAIWLDREGTGAGDDRITSLADLPGLLSLPGRPCRS